MAFSQARTKGRIINRRYRPGRNNGRVQNVRKGFGEGRRPRNLGFKKNRNDRSDPRRTKIIDKRRRRLNERPAKKGKVDKDDLDRQMR